MKPVQNSSLKPHLSILPTGVATCLSNTQPFNLLLHRSKSWQKVSCLSLHDQIITLPRSHHHGKNDHDRSLLLPTLYLKWYKYQEHPPSRLSSRVSDNNNRPCKMVNNRVNQRNNNFKLIPIDRSFSPFLPLSHHHRPIISVRPLEAVHPPHRPRPLLRPMIHT